MSIVRSRLLEGVPRAASKVHHQPLDRLLLEGILRAWFRSVKPTQSARIPFSILIGSLGTLGLLTIGTLVGPLGRCRLVLISAAHFSGLRPCMRAKLIMSMHVRPRSPRHACKRQCRCSTLFTALVADQLSSLLSSPTLQATESMHRCVASK
jgi:hypothetical protein